MVFIRVFNIVIYVGTICILAYLVLAKVSVLLKVGIVDLQSSKYFGSEYL